MEIFHSKWVQTLQLHLIRVIFATGYPRHRENRENGKKKSLSGKTQGFWNLEDISRFAVNVSNFFLKLDKSAKSVLCML